MIGAVEIPLSSHSTSKLKHRYPGLDSFHDTDLDRQLYYGRTKEASTLFNQILTDNLTVLYGKSGVGKSSLLRAGIFYQVREEDFYPIIVRFNDPEINLAQTIINSTEEAIQNGNIEIVRIIERSHIQDLWLYFHSFKISKDKIRLTPLLIFDQFEEIFTLHSKINRENLFVQLAHLINDSVPSEITDICDYPDAVFEKNGTLAKVIISIREDFYVQLEQIKKKIPAIYHSVLRLTGLNRDRAKLAISGPARLVHSQLLSNPFSYSEEALDAIVDFLLTDNKGNPIEEVEPFQLQLLCLHFEQIAIQQQVYGKSDVIINLSDITGHIGMSEIISNFYEAQIKQFNSFFKRRAIRSLCEKRLINENGNRLFVEEKTIRDKYSLSRDDLDSLVNRHIFTRELRNREAYYELAHDTLVEPILKSYKNRNKRNKPIAFFIIASIISSSVFSMYIIVESKNDLYKKNQELNQKFELYKDSASRVPVSKYLSANNEVLTGEYTAAIKKYETIISEDSTELNPYLELGSLYNQINKHDLEIETYERALRNTPPGVNNSVIYYKAASAYNKKYQNNTYDYSSASKAEEYFKMSINSITKYEKDPKLKNIILDEYFQFLFADIDQEKSLRSKEQKRDEIKKLIKLIDSTEPVETTYKLALQGYIEELSGNSRKANSYYRKALNNNINSAAINYLYGLALQKEGSIEQAKQYFDIALQINPTHKGASIASYEANKPKVKSVTAPIHDPHSIDTARIIAEIDSALRVGNKAKGDSLHKIYLVLMQRYEDQKKADKKARELCIEFRNKYYETNGNGDYLLKAIEANKSIINRSYKDEGELAEMYLLYSFVPVVSNYRSFYIKQSIETSKLALNKVYHDNTYLWILSNLAIAHLHDNKPTSYREAGSLLDLIYSNIIKGRIKDEVITDKRTIFNERIIKKLKEARQKANNSKSIYSIKDIDKLIVKFTSLENTF